MMRKTIAGRGSVVIGLLVIGLVAGCPEEKDTAGTGADSSAGSSAEPSGTASKESGTGSDAGERVADGDSGWEAAPDPHGQPAGTDPHAAADPHAGIDPHRMPPISNPHAAAGNAVSADADGVLTVTGISFDVPEGWTKEQPSGSMRLAQYSIPGEAGAAELVVYNFGPGMGGGVDANIERWIGQFKNPDDASAKAKSDVSRGMRGDLTVTKIIIEGTYAPGAMPGMPATGPMDDAGLYGLIIEGGPAGSLFIKVTGPKATLDAANDSLEAFNQSARKAE